MTFPVYPEYKKSGVSWLGDMPVHWQLLPLRGLANPGRDSFIDGDWIESPFITDSGVRLLQTGNIGVGIYKEQGFRYISEKTFVDLRCTEINPGDVLICRLADPVGRACLAPSLSERMITSVDVCILKLSMKFDNRYVVYLLSSENYLSYMESQCRGGTRDRVSRSFLGAVRVPMLPLLEQSAIATFLDRETAKIDALIAGQERLITLLDEKRQATITHGVTKGLNKNVPMKDSGVEWLGDVPKHWHVSPIKYIAIVGNGSTPNRDEPKYWSGGSYPWLNSSVVNQDKVTEAEQFVTEAALKECHLPIVVPPAILVGITGQGRTRGMAATLLFEATINQHVVYIKPRSDSINVDFLRRVFDMAYQYLRSESDSAGSTKGAITCDQILRLNISFPGIDEQAMIVSFLNDEIARLDALVNEASRGIALLQERRSALVSAVVTGKIDVRQAVQQEQSTMQEAA